MRKLLNTLYVSTQGAYLAKEGECLLARVDRETKGRFPIHNLGGVVCFGNVLCSPFLLGHCAKNGVTVSMLTENGRFLARVVGEVSGNVLLRKEQFRRAESAEQSTEIATYFVLGKTANCRRVLQRAAGEKSKDTRRLAGAVEHLSGSLRRLKLTATVDAVRGIEGDVAKVYFSVFNELITGDSATFQFVKRTRRPPLDPVNALLSFVYTLLMHDVRGALETVGLDTQVGFLHCDRSGRPSLALDMMEELRPVFADRLVLSLINRGQLKAKNFTSDPGGAVMMDEKGRKTVLKAWQERKRDTITHPFLKEKIAFGLIPHVQALLFARFLRGDLDGYPPFLWK